MTPAAPPGDGHLVVIGGHEDLDEDRGILKRFVELSGGDRARIVVVTAASAVPDRMWSVYDGVLAELGALQRTHLDLAARQDADGDAAVRAVREATGIFMSGGDQKRLLALVGDSALAAAMHAALARGACIGGTSAGASAMSGRMLAQGRADLQPEKGAVTLGAGLGFLQHVVIDQHFSERHRLSRLLSVVAQNPALQGIGIDEDTALVIARGVGIEVLGKGAVTVVDGRAMRTDIADIPDHATPELIDVRLHLLPAGSRYRLPHPDRPAVDGGADGHTPPAPLLDFIDIVTQRHPPP